MPELPEVETTKRGIVPFLLHQRIDTIVVRQSKLRLPINPDIQTLCQGKSIHAISRRGKYILIELTQGYLLIHLGMSGHLRILTSPTPVQKHDHVDLCLSNGTILRYHDPRRFGLWHYIAHEPLKHPLLSRLGPEPLSNDFGSDYLARLCQRKTQAIKSVIMDSQVVVGVGNIYATESLYLAKTHPATAAKLLNTTVLAHLCQAIKHCLTQAIELGGTTLRDFYTTEGKPGYFANVLQVYGRESKPCLFCQTPIESMTLGGRRSTFCPQCQPQMEP